MTDAEISDLADVLERSARCEHRPQVAATLQLAAAQLRGDRIAKERLRQLLALIPVEHLISVAALVLEQRAAEGDAMAWDAGAYLHAAGPIVTMDQQ
jgi:mono/diheme cytochrome c family protein